ncbi:MAG: response regulator [Alphaproteobacteria bacterium]|nr:response regulator [Alphaproteobacteria bacterium]MBV8549650.1 response regulator [Alphaproteobacteria bacterium]
MKKPGLSSLQNLSLAKKLALCEIIFLIPITILICFLIVEKRDVILFTDIEREGVHYLGAIGTILYDFSKPDFSQRDLERDIEHFKEAALDNGELPRTVEALRFDTKNVISTLSVTDKANGARTMRNLALDLMDRFNLSLDPDIATYHLAEAEFNQLPKILAGQAKLLDGLRLYNPHSPEQQVLSTITNTTIMEAKDSFSSDMAKVLLHIDNPEVVSELANDELQFLNNIDLFMTAMKGGNGEDIFASAYVVSDSAERMGNKLNQTLTNLLHERIRALMGVLFMQIIIALASIVAGTYVAFKIVSQTTGPLGIILAHLETLAFEIARTNTVEDDEASDARDNEIGKLNRVLGAFRKNIEDFKDIAQALQETEAASQLLFKHNPLPMLVYDRETLSYLALNEAIVKMLGWPYEEFLGMTILDTAHEDDRERMAASVGARGAGAYASGPWTLRRADGSTTVAEAYSDTIRYFGRDAVLCVVIDVTEKKKLEGQLLQAQKMEAIGKLTGGVAHDFNNLLGIIIGSLGLLQKRLQGQQESVKQLSDNALFAAMRGADLTRHLLAFARQQPLRPECIMINGLIENLARMVSQTLPSQVEVIFRPDGDLWPIEADPAQLESCILNLITNARDAMPSGGTIFIRTMTCIIDEAYVKTHPNFKVGDYVVAEVTDTGTGMSAETVEHIFEPFFTTKARDKGTGLGLSMVFGFIKQSNGQINVYSEVGMGTTFRLYFPRTYQKIAVVPDLSKLQRASGNNETILVVDDNNHFRFVVTSQLQELGYNVREASNAAEALDQLSAGPLPDLLMTDIVMPGKLTGLGLARLAQDNWPSLKIILTSGFPETALNARGEVTMGLPLLSKPYMIEELASLLARILVYEHSDE